MTATTFTNFTSLAKELRDMIWLEAAAIQFEEKKPPRFIDWSDESWRQAFVNYDDLPTEPDRAPLGLFVLDPYNGQKMRVDLNDLETLINYLPISAVSREARFQAINFCRTRVSYMRLWYYNKSPFKDVGHLELPEDETNSIIVRDHGGLNTLEHIFAQPKTLMVSTSGLESFESPEHFVDVVIRFFGHKVERLILNFINPWEETLEQVYWPHKAETRAEPIFIDDPDHDPSTVFMTSDRRLHVAEQTWKEGRCHRLTEHLQKFYELLDVAAKRLPRLHAIDLKLESFFSEPFSSRIKSSYRDGALRVKMSDVDITYDDVFVDGLRHLRRSLLEYPLRQHLRPPTSPKPKPLS
ncbi:hypothetical protein N0V90_006783 [Kalmusia sp. IMI 367209]|nr:hypothetical protein N0V90_006783 [Kalmusia sp. IMI 367209]